MTAEEERLWLESDFGRNLPLPKREAVPMPSCGFPLDPTPDKPRKLSKAEKIALYNAGKPFGEYEDDD